MIEPNKNKDSKIYQDLEVELYKKTGKGLGLSVVGRRDGYGVFISDMVCITFSVKKCWPYKIWGLQIVTIPKNVLVSCYFTLINSK